ncbi:hypothetical protein D9758_002776 [Tetrapyrgos nigripes]|uniref:F-box domain-containing protein n=1 Tax=Tetrapyrgos nigripes TaxID=182062 RepID=A0A8H5GRM6_9AGAR|nr:hypothetical protein D9758_002776 [Tetrapyrgos nigripes]
MMKVALMKALLDAGSIQIFKPVNPIKARKTATLKDEPEPEEEEEEVEANSQGQSIPDLDTTLPVTTSSSQETAVETPPFVLDPHYFSKLLGPEEEEEVEVEEFSQRPSICHVARLPVELLTEIFTWLVYDDHVNVFLLCGICQHWRSVTLNNPALWRTLVVWRKCPIRKGFSWLERSQRRIHELRLRKPLRYNTRWSLSDFDSLQWDQLRICHLENVDLFSHLTSISKFHHLRLQELSICHSHSNCLDSSEDQWNTDRLLSHLFSPLQCLSLDGFAVKHWTGITSLSSLVLRNVNRQPLHSFYSFLSANPLLQDLFISDTSFTPFPGHPPSDPLSLPHLTTLKLHNYLYWSGNFFSHMSFPALNKLLICDCDDINFDALLDKLEDGLKSLVELSVEGCAFRDVPKFLRVLALNTLLERLTIRRSRGVWNPLLEELKFRGLCPRLTHLDLSRCADVKGILLLKFIEARNPLSGLSFPIPNVLPIHLTPVQLDYLRAKVRTTSRSPAPLPEPAPAPVAQITSLTALHCRLSPSLIQLLRQRAESLVADADGHE